MDINETIIKVINVDIRTVNCANVVPIFKK
jgi:hypothetical protein